MTVLEAAQKLRSLGIPLKFFSEKGVKDSATLSQWLHGTRKITPLIEDRIANAIMELVNEIKTIEIDHYM